MALGFAEAERSFRRTQHLAKMRARKPWTLCKMVMSKKAGVAVTAASALEA